MLRVCDSPVGVARLWSRSAEWICDCGVVYDCEYTCGCDCECVDRTGLDLRGLVDGVAIKECRRMGPESWLSMIIRWGWPRFRCRALV